MSLMLGYAGSLCLLPRVAACGRGVVLRVWRVPFVCRRCDIDKGPPPAHRAGFARLKDLENLGGVLG